MKDVESSSRRALAMLSIAPMRVVPIPCLKDNYAYLLFCEKTGASAIVDASEAAPVRAACAAEGTKPGAIWSTHHHWDHVGGNEELAKELGIADVWAYVTDGEQGRVPGQTRRIADAAP